MGEPGSGKTDSLTTWIEAGKELFVIVTEPDGVASLLDSCERRKLNVDKLHWMFALPAVPGWEALEEMTKAIGTMTFQQIAEIKSGIGKEHTRKPAWQFIQNGRNFVCERTGEAFGSVDKWDESRVIAIDSLSGLSLIAWMLTVGYKAGSHQGDWGSAMNFIEQLLLKFANDCKCYFTLTAHIEREINELTGSSRIMVSTLGRKLPPKIPRFFSEVILAKRTLKGTTPVFTWATVDALADLKNRALPCGTDLTPSFVPVVRAYERRLKLAGATLPPPAPLTTQLKAAT
jgi:hypothetical protein